MMNVIVDSFILVMMRLCLFSCFLQAALQSAQAGIESSFDQKLVTMMMIEHTARWDAIVCINCFLPDWLSSKLKINYIL